MSTDPRAAIIESRVSTTDLYSYTRIDIAREMDSSNQSPYAEQRTTVEAREELLIFLLLFSSSQASKETTSALEFRTNLSWNQDDLSGLGLVVGASPVSRSLL